MKSQLIPNSKRLKIKRPKRSAKKTKTNTAVKTKAETKKRRKRRRKRKNQMIKTIHNVWFIA